MATPSFSATLNFVKQYPITLCGFSLLFMPSVHRLLLYFTPLLLSTAIFIVAMMSWGPSESAEKSTTSGRSKPKLMREHPEWALNKSMGIDDDNVDDESDSSLHYIAVSSCLGNLSDDIQNAPDRAGTGPSPPDGASATATCGAEPDPDLQGEGFGATAEDDDVSKHVESDAQVSSCLGNLSDDVEAAPDGVAAATSGASCQSTPPDGKPGTPVGGANNHRLAEPELDLQGEGVGAVAEDDDDEEQYVESDEMRNVAHDDAARVPDIVLYAPNDGHAAISCALQGMGHAHEEDHYLQLCA